MSSLPARRGRHNARRLRARPAPVRSVRWLRRPDDLTPWGLIGVRVGPAVRVFHVREVSFDVFDGRGFLVERRAGGRQYHVEVCRAGRCHCDCAAALALGRCVHSEALALLLARGDMPDPAGPCNALLPFRAA